MLVNSFLIDNLVFRLGLNPKSSLPHNLIQLILFFVSCLVEKEVWYDVCRWLAWEWVLPISQLITLLSLDLLRRGSGTRFVGGQVESGIFRAIWLGCFKLLHPYEGSDDLGFVIRFGTLGHSHIGCSIVVKFIGRFGQTRKWIIDMNSSKI